MTNVATAPVTAKVKATYLAAEDLKLAASLLYQAYHDDPVFLEIFNGEKDDYEQSFPNTWIQMLRLIDISH